MFLFYSAKPNEYISISPFWDYMSIIPILVKSLEILVGVLIFAKIYLLFYYLGLLIYIRLVDYRVMKYDQIYGLWVMSNKYYKKRFILEFSF